MTDRTEPREEKEPDAARQEYALRAARHEDALADLRRTSLRLSTLRVVTFLAAGAAFLVVDVAAGTVERWALAVALLLSVGFLVEVAAHRGVRRRERWHRALLGLAREGILRVHRRWDELAAALPDAEAHVAPPPADHAFARDLDVLGDASLARLAGPVTTEGGRATLRAWLLAPARPDEAVRRLAAVRELAPDLDLRMTFAAYGRLEASKAPAALERFLAWAEGASWLSSLWWARGAVWLLPATLVGLVLADVFLGLPPYWVLPALAQAELLRRVWPRVHKELILAEAGTPLVAAQVPQFAMVEDGPGSSPLLRELTERLGVGAEAASSRTRRLGRLLDTVSSRRNVVYAALSPVLLLDLHLTLALDRWRNASGHAVRGWLDALGAWEALSSLASLAFDHPDWCDPEFTDAEVVRVTGTDLGHPLLPPEECVRNDVAVGPPGTFLLVTGSNMSGKTTLLRAVGGNVVLAGAGAPVCAASFSLPHVRVHTSMRVDDSLAQGVSLFMAELLRIRGIVEAADAPGPPVLYLLDEILHGTNTAERRVAARAVIRHLLARDAVGAVSSHDLTLAQAPDLDAAASKVHFREQVERPGGRTKLTFDYRLRPGLATTRNALKLLDAVGLGGLVDESAGEDGDEEIPGDAEERS
ncbi:MAG TPA: MutS family DNA mismatch repair protein [Longimicrobiales bacterium]|nr:MutS family DNA mismatch repair protein [Longimicrobiales bacterium]